MAKSSKGILAETKALMGALLRQPPKQHDQIRAPRKKKAAKKTKRL